MSLARPMCQVILHGVLLDHAQIETLQLTPTEVELELNDYRTADTCRVTLAWQTFPFDPRQFEALGVDIYIGPAIAGPLPLNADTIVFSGLIDKPQTRADHESITMTLEGRDFTALFLDWKWQTTIKLGTLTQTLRSIVAQVPGAETMQVVLEGVADISLSVPGGRTRYTPEKDVDSWTVITDLVRLVGGVVFVRLNQIVVSAPANLFRRSIAPVMLWGRDIQSLEYGTELKSMRHRGVKVICRDPVSGKVNTVLYPNNKKPVLSHTRRKVVQTEHFIEWLVEGVPHERLQTIARQMWELQSRNQVEGSLETQRMYSLDENTPLWRVRHGSPLRILTPSSVAGQLASLPQELAVTQLTQSTFRMRRDVAAAFVKAAKDLQAADTAFYVQRARHRWSAQSGYSATFDFINFVTIDP